MLLGTAILGVLLSAEPPPPNTPPPKPPPVERVVEVADPQLKKEIDECVARGVAWLKARQKEDGSWPELDDLPSYGGGAHAIRYKAEMSALALLALLKAGMPASDPCAVKGFAYLRQQAFSSSGAYGCGVTLMALEAAGTKGGAEEVQSPGSKKKDKGEKPSGDHAAWAAALTARILGLQGPQGGWRYGCPAPLDLAGGLPGFADVSATQYALLGLKAARHMGIPVDTAVFSRASDFLLDQQEKDGKTVTRVTKRTGKEEAGDTEVAYGDKCRGWPYMKGAAGEGEATASMAMTGAGLTGLLVCRSECLESKSWKPADRAKRISRIEQAIHDGLAWLDAHWSVEQNPPRGGYELGYALYSLERVGMMADLRFIGPGHDWYVEGAKVWTGKMVKEGTDKGWWEMGASRTKSETQDTPYGLLFLKKASLKLGYPIGEEK